MDLSIQGLTATYGDTVAVRELSIDIPDGELLVLLGPSGCGKTTTMRCIVGLESPISGRIRIGDRAVFDAAQSINVPANKRDVGMVFQSYAIWPHMTVNDNISFPLRMRGYDKSDISKHVNQALSMVGLDGFGDRSASLLSGGQMQRVAVARSVVGEPQTLLLDEPLSNLDAKLRDQLRFELREIQQRLGITTVYVTHDQNEALALADRIAVMRSGEIVQLGDPASLYRQPNSVFSAQFLGVDNIFPGTVIAQRTDGADIALAVSGATIESDGTVEHEPGASVHVCVRAEDIELHSDPIDDKANGFPAVVKSTSYLGDRTRYRLALDAGPELYAAISDRKISFAVGSRVHARFSPEAALLVDE